MKYSFEILTDGTMHDTMYGGNSIIRAVVFRDKREDPKAPDAYNDYCKFQAPDPLCYDDLAEFKAVDDERRALRKQWKRDVLDALGIKDGHVTNTDTEFFTALEITEAEE